MGTKTAPKMAVVPVLLFFCLLLANFSFAERWAIEFEGSFTEAEEKANQYALAEGLNYLGRIGILNAFEFSFPEALESSKRDSLSVTKAQLRFVSESSEGKQPTHPIASLQEVYERSDLAHQTQDAASMKKDAKMAYAEEFGILWAQEQVDKAFEKRASLVAFSDPLYPQQYHLHKISPGLATLNTTGAWESGITGEGVTIAIVDDGLQHIHPDIRPNYRSAGSYNFDFNRPDPSPNSMTADYHGTSSAGVAASRDDGATCGVGVAYRAGLAGIAILQNDALNDAKEARALQYAMSVNDIYSNSWGPPDGGSGFVGPGALTKQALDIGAASGRNGRGAIYVWAGGNGGARDNCNYDGYASSRYAVTVGAVDAWGLKSSFSEQCAALLVVAPSASNERSYIRTTDLLGRDGRAGGDCNLAFSGTSAACPAVAGVVALMLQANPTLTWLDVQRVLIETAYKNDPSSNTWAQNGAGKWVSHNYGFGLTDASAAVERAKTIGIDDHMSREILLSYQVPKSIPWATLPSSGSSAPLVGMKIEIPIAESVVIHHVEVLLDDLRTPDSGRLDVQLMSPMGTNSILAVPHQRNAANLRNWKFTSRRLWGETSQGTWTLTILDATTQGALNSFSLRIWGTPSATTYSNIFKTQQDDGRFTTPDAAPPSSSTPVKPAPTTAPTPAARPAPAPTVKPTPVPAVSPVFSPASTPPDSFIIPDSKAHNQTQIIIVVVSVILGSLVVAAIVAGIIWYWKNQRLESYAMVGAMEDLHEDIHGSGGSVPQAYEALAEELGADDPDDPIMLEVDQSSNDGL